MSAVPRPVSATHEGPAAAALRARRERLQAIEAEAAPLRGQRASRFLAWRVVSS